ncbi:hypothetical protein ACHAWC_000867 [Mediolabrus comicus]
MSCVSIVVQRFRQCKILIDERIGLLSEEVMIAAVVYFFASSSSVPQVETAAQTLLNIPVLTTGLWGDGESVESLLSLAAASSSSCSLIIIPQANLISKVKQQGKSIQYHGQINKQRGSELYDHFCSYIQGLLLEAQCEIRSQDLPDWYLKRRAFLQQQQQQRSYSAATPPEQIFQDDTKYSEWDEKGIPTKDSEGVELTKSGRKKLSKIYDAHMKKHIKWKEENGGTTNALPTPSIATQETSPPDEQYDDSLDPAFCHFIKGSFGKRQGLEFISDMGPFVHSFQV